MKTKIEQSLEQFDARIKSWKPAKRSDPTAKWYAADRKELRRVRAMFRRKRYTEFLESVDMLDTIIRELVPRHLVEVAETMTETAG